MGEYTVIIIKESFKDVNDTCASAFSFDTREEAMSFFDDAWTFPYDYEDDEYFCRRIEVRDPDYDVIADWDNDWNPDYDENEDHPPYDYD